MMAGIMSVDMNKCLVILNISLWVFSAILEVVWVCSMHFDTITLNMN